MASSVKQRGGTEGGSTSGATTTVASSIKAKLQLTTTTATTTATPPIPGSTNHSIISTSSVATTITTTTNTGIGPATTKAKVQTSYRHNNMNTNRTMLGGSSSHCSLGSSVITSPKIASAVITIDKKQSNSNNTVNNNSKNNTNINNQNSSNSNGGGGGFWDGDTESEISSISDFYYGPSFNSNVVHYQANHQAPIQHEQQLRVRPWDRKQLYSDFIRSGLLATQQHSNNNNKKLLDNVVMLFESPSCSTHETSFFNGQTFKFYDYPPSPPVYKSVLAPCRYSMMNGNVYPSYLLDGTPPTGLVEHWKQVIPNFVSPTFVSSEMDMKSALVYAYLPVEYIPNHVNNPHVHYHVSGKDILHLMTRRTPKLLTNTRDRRPCICKATHSMGSKGIFIIRNDDDERRFEKILSETGNPTFVVTEYIEAVQSTSCHFFIHPPNNSNEITWFGSNENVLPTTCATNQAIRAADGITTTTITSSSTTTTTMKNSTTTSTMLLNCSSNTDTIIVMKDQERLKRIQLPFVQDVVKYFQARDFWGFCGIDVLFDKNNNGYLVDVHPRVTGSSPAIMVAYRLMGSNTSTTTSTTTNDNSTNNSGYEYCIFRRGCRYAYNGTAKQLLEDVQQFNTEHINQTLIVLTGFVEIDTDNDTSTTECCSSNSNQNSNSVPVSTPPLQNTTTTTTTTTADTSNNKKTLVQLAVYSKNSLEECQTVLNTFSKPLPKHKNQTKKK